MDNGSYLLVLSRTGNRIISDMKLMGSQPCYSYETLEEAQVNKLRMEREFDYNVTIVQIIK